MKLRSLLLLGCLALGFVTRLPAQEPPRPAPRPPAAPARDADPKSRDVALADLFDQYSRLIGKKIAPDSSISLNATCTLLGLEDCSPAQRINLMEKTLFLSGYSLVDADADTVVVLGPGRIPRSVGLPLYTRPEDIPAGERVFSYACRLEHADAIEMAGVLTQWVPGGNTVNFTAAPKTRLVIATAPTSVMRAVLRLVALLDTPADVQRH